MFLDEYKRLGHRFKKRRWLSHLLAYFFARQSEVTAPRVNPKTLLIVRVDRIGDYVLFRDFLRAVRQSERFVNYHITLCGNAAFRDIAESFDADVVDDFVWMNRSRFTKNIYAHFTFLNAIRERGFETVVQPTFSRDIYGDLIVNASAAPVRIGVAGDHSNQSPQQRKITDTFYTTLLDVKAESIFEFYRNREVMQAFLEQTIEINKPTWPASPKTTLVNERNYAVFIIGAGDRRKRWDKFDRIADFVFVEFGCHIVFVGKEKRDRKIILKLTKHAEFEFVNLCDQVPLSQVGDVLKKSRLVVGNDSGLIHIAAMQHVPTVCLSPGAHASRFNVYPAAFNFKVIFLFPPELEKIRNSGDFQNYSARYRDSYDVRSISVERVKRTIQDILSDE